MEKNRTTAGKAESKIWRRNATLKDLLDLLDEIEASDKVPEEKAKLRQRVVDYAQHLSKEIYEGKKSVPASDTNETIKRFNNRLYSTYSTKGNSSYEEGKDPKGYYDKEGKFIKVDDDYADGGRVTHVNPRWHPIPLKDTVLPPPPPPVDITDETGKTGGGATGTTSQTEKTGGGATGGSNTTNSSELTNTASKSSKKKHRLSPLWLIPIAIAGVEIARNQLGNSDEPSQIPPSGNGGNTETVDLTKLLTPSEQDHLRYTIEKGQRMTAKQFNVSIEEGAEIYNQFAENIRQGNIPQELMTMTDDYNMSKMINEDLGLDLDCPEIAATTWLLMSESYPSIAKTIHKAMVSPEEQVGHAEQVLMKKYIPMAKTAAEEHGVNPESNLVSTVDYGLYGANVKTGWAISFRKAQEDSKKIDKTDKAMYQGIVDNAVHNGVDY